MKKVTFRLAAVSLVFGVISLAPLASLQAAPVPLTDAKIETIRQNCLSAQVALQRIQRSDAATRVNRGQTYEVILTKLMSPFNGRLAFNRLDEASPFTAITKKYERAVDTFKEDYAKYEDSLSKTLKIKCQDQPVTFYDTLTATREARAKVAKDIDAITKILQEYYGLVNTLQTSLPQNGDAVTGDS